MHFHVLSLFPSYVQIPLDQSILKRAIDRGIIQVTTVDIRDFTLDKHKRVDDRPYGGGPGMVMTAEPIIRAIQANKTPDTKVIYLSPQGRKLSPYLAKELAQEKNLMFVCGHYEGIDQRVLDSEIDMEVSIGDFVLTNGCLAALVVIDVIARYIPQVLGDEAAAYNDSFEKSLLDCPHYTKPDIFNGRQVPTTLKSGNHKDIAQWRQDKAIEATWCKRPDVMASAILERFVVEEKKEKAESDFAFLSMSFPSRHIQSCRLFYEKLFNMESSIVENSDLIVYYWILDRRQPKRSVFSLFHYNETNTELPISGAYSFELTQFHIERFVLWWSTYAKKKYEDVAGLQKQIVLERKIVVQDPDGRLLLLVAKEELEKQGQ